MNNTTASSTTITTAETATATDSVATNSGRRFTAGAIGATIATTAVMAIAAPGTTHASASAQGEFPNITEFARDFVADVPTELMTRATGAELEHLGLPLDSSTSYLYAEVGSDGFHLDLPQVAGLDVEILPPAMSFPDGDSLIVVVDPADPFVYVGGPCPKPPPDQRRGGVLGPVRDVKRVGRAVEGLADMLGAGTGPLPVIPSELTGPDCGFGMSVSGNIPAPATANGSEFSANVVFDGTLGVHPAVEVDGRVFARIDDSGLRASATGTALTKVPFVDALVELAIPLGDAAVELQADDERIGLAVAGSVELADSYELPIAGIPLTLPAHGNASAAMRFGMVSTPTGWMVDPTSFIEVEGNAGIGLGSFGRATGLDLHDIAGAHVSARIDRHGARVQGTANLSIHPAISTGAGAAFDLLVSADDFSKSRLDFDADVTVGGSRLATADVSLSSRGLHVAGGLRVGGAAVDLNGQITPTGADIAGSTSVVFPLDAIADLSDGVRSDIGRARQNLRNYDTAIANRRIVVRDERTARDRGLAHAITAVSNAERSIQQINNTIAHNKNLINQRRSWINSEIRWFNTLPWWRKPVEAPGHAARLTAWNAQIASWDAANAAQRVARDTATAGLRTARQVMSQIKAALAAANVDDDLEIRRLKSTKQVELDLLNTLEATLRQVRPGAAVRGDIAFRLGTSGLSGSLSARYCDAAGCTTLAGGRVRIGNPTEACVDVLALGEACVRL